MAKFKKEKEEKVEEVQAEVEEKKDERAGYNCDNCKGEGLVGDDRCSFCLGTGKV